MKLWKVAATVAVGVMHSGSGMFQVSAADYFFITDFETKTVANFDDYTQTFNPDTSDLDLEGVFYWEGSYRYDACPTTFTQTVQYLLYFRIGTTGAYSLIGGTTLPPFTCSTSYQTFYAEVRTALSSAALDAIVNDDDANISIYPHIVFLENAPTAGRVLELSNFTYGFEINYNFNTTYLFNYFLSDIQYLDRQVSGGPWDFTFSTQVQRLIYVYTTAGNDNYYIANNNPATIGSIRKRYAIDYENEYFRGNSVGAAFEWEISGSAFVDFDAAGQSYLAYRMNYYYLNVANKEQEIGIVPEFEYEYEDCGWLSFDIPCFVNNAITYVVNDAPVVSDAFTLLNAGMKLGGQAFAVIGQFSDNNLFGVLVLGGLGITAVRWFLKND